MAQVDQIQIGSTTYDILQSDNASFTGVSNDTTDSGATSWTSVAKLANTETNASIFTKMSSMFKNIRFLYSKIGDLDIGDIGTSIGDAIKNLAENKADKDHTHTASTLKASDGTNLIVTSLSNSSDNNHVPSALLIKNMNDTLTSLSNASTSYVTKLGVSGKTVTYYHGSSSLGTITTQDTNTTYANATTAAAGLLPKLAGDTTKFLRSDGTWAVNNSGATYTITKNGSNIILTGSNGYTGSVADSNTTYAVVTTAANGLAPKLAGGTTKFLRADGNWIVPPDTNTTYATNTSGVKYTWDANSGTLTLNALTVRV